MSVTSGDLVLVPDYGTAINLDEEEFHVYRDEDIMGILKSE